YLVTLFFSIIRRRTSFPLLPYTTLFRSGQVVPQPVGERRRLRRHPGGRRRHHPVRLRGDLPGRRGGEPDHPRPDRGRNQGGRAGDRKSTRLNSSHLGISYAVFCLKKKTC